MKKTSFVMVFLLLALTAQAVMVDNFETYTPGLITAPWIVKNGTSTFGQEASGNKYLESYGSCLALEGFSIPNANIATTVFFRIYKLTATGPDVSAGLCNTATPAAAWSDYECQVVVVGGELRARNGATNSNVAILTPMSEGIWHNIWMVINNSANTYDVYVTTGSAGATLSDRKATNFSFRNGGTNDLLSFKVYGYNYAPIRIDDINISPGTDLTIPSMTSPPAVIVSNPGNVAVNETQNASFQTGFTSETTPTIEWYKVASPADIVMNPANIQLTYDALTQRYTSTLSMTDLTVSDNGRYYCRVNNESGYPRNSTPAILTVYGLVAHWTMNQSDFVSGHYRDVVGGYHAAASGMPMFTAGADGSANGAVQITSASGWAAVNGFNPGSTGQITISVWAYWKETSVASDDVRVESLPGGAAISAAGALKSNNHWQQICGVFNGTTGKVYVDGKLCAQGPCTLPADMTSLLNIGSADSGSESFNGMLDDLRIYNYAMDDIGVAELRFSFAGLRSCIYAYNGQFDRTGPEGTADCSVDIYDLNDFILHYLTSDANYDITGPSNQPDGIVNLYDFSAMALSWLDCGLYPDCP